MSEGLSSTPEGAIETLNKKQEADLAKPLTESGIIISNENTKEIDQESVGLIEKLHEFPVMLIEKAGKKSLSDIKAKAPDKDICFCDGYIEGTENWERDGAGFKRENVLVIDHHMPLEEMSRNISTTNLVINYVKKHGPVGKDVVTMISHTDCDSILSVAIMRGILKPKEEYGTSAIAADHTGEPNAIGDLLQSLEIDEQGKDLRDIEFSLRNLELLLQGKELEPRAKNLLQLRYKDREKALQIVEEKFESTDSGKTFYAEVDKKIDGGLLPAIIPSAHIIILFCPMYDKNTGEKLKEKEAKIRLGLRAPSGIDLRKIMELVDKKFGGRWDAGSNGRNGGTILDVETYAQMIDKIYGGCI